MKSLRSTINKILKDIKCLKCAIQELVEGGGSGGGGIQSIQEGTNITVDNTDPLNPIVSSTGGELEKITEGANTGYALRDRTAANYGDIGNDAVDFSLSNSASTTKGVTGARSAAFGLNNTVAANNSFAAGANNIIPLGNNNSAIFGINNTISQGSSYGGWNFVAGESNTLKGSNATSFGWNNTNNGHSIGNNGTFITGGNNSSTLVYGAMLGAGLTGSAFCTTVVGKANTEFNYDNGIDPNKPLSPIFVVGNGTISHSLTVLTRSNAFEILQNGLITAPSLTTALIDTAGAKALITKEYGDANYITSAFSTVGTGLPNVNPATAGFRTGKIGLNEPNPEELLDIVGTQTGTTGGVKMDYTWTSGESSRVQLGGQKLMSEIGVPNDITKGNVIDYFGAGSRAGFRSYMVNGNFGAVNPFLGDFAFSAGVANLAGTVFANINAYPQGSGYDIVQRTQNSVGDVASVNVRQYGLSSPNNLESTIHTIVQNSEGNNASIRITPHYVQSNNLQKFTNYGSGIFVEGYTHTDDVTKTGTTATTLGTPTATLTVDADGNIIERPINKLVGYTVATLPAGEIGDTAYVTDATSPTYLTAVVGGGAITCPVFFDGINWIAH